MLRRATHQATISDRRAIAQSLMRALLVELGIALTGDAARAEAVFERALALA